MVAPEGHSRAFPSNGKAKETFFTLTAGQGAGDRQGFDSSCSKQVWGGNVRNETDGEDGSWLMESFTIRPYKATGIAREAEQAGLVSVPFPGTEETGLEAEAVGTHYCAQWRSDEQGQGGEDPNQDSAPKKKRAQQT